MPELKTGRLRQDDSSHWYLIPEEHLFQFETLSNVIEETPAHTDRWNDLCGEFDNEFSKYRIDGVEEVRVIIEQE